MQLKKNLLLLFAIISFALQAKENNIPKEVLSYGKGENNWLNLYQASSNKPTPVYIWAHPNSDGKVLPSANDIPKPLVQTLKDNGISVISWESVPQLKELSELKICQQDMETLYQWVVNNAKKYNFDINQLYIGGSSRGTVVVWQFINQYPTKIKGAYLVQALPKGAWVDASRNPLVNITDKSPRIVLSYRDPMDSKDGHSPQNGQKIINKYTQLGIGDRATLYHTQGKELYKHLLEFITGNK